MKTFKKYTKLSQSETNMSVFIPQNTIFADIETTGLSYRKHFIYCIGISYIEDDSLVILQWFAEKRQEEIEILHEFLQVLSKGIEVILTFNGRTFDLPFIEKRCQYHQLYFDRSSFAHRDLLQEIRPLRHLLALSHLRQKNIENFLDINREDLYDGGRLTEVYREYEKNHDPELLHLLWLHNYEDMKGMFHILPVLSYKSLLDGRFDITRLICEEYADCGEQINRSLSIEITYSSSLPQTVTRISKDVKILLKEVHGIISLPLFSGELKYFLKDYKNYYYLIDEDTVIHKSVGQFVDKQYRIPAKKEQCFLKKCGYFLPGISPDTLCCFRSDYRSKQSYIDLTDLWQTKGPINPEDVSEELLLELHDLILYRLGHAS